MNDPYEIPIKAPRCGRCNHSETSHTTRNRYRAKGMEIGRLGGVYRCTTCPCRAWVEPSEVTA